jgi:Flp pilus assembly protein TadG
MQHSVKSPSSKQGGFMTVMFLILVGLFLTFAAFALDLGNFYLWQLRLDKAARAGALAGIGYRGLHGYTAASTDSGQGIGQGIKDAATSAVRDNLKTYGFYSTNTNGEDNKLIIHAPQYNPSADSLTVKVEYQIPTILVVKLSNVLGFGFNSDPHQSSGDPGRILHTRAHTAALSAANVVLLLDVSGSMLCPITTNCACRRNNSCPVGEATKLSRLVTGVQTFAQFFNPERDRISVIAFNLAARRLFSFTDNNPTNPNSLNLSSATLLDAINDSSGTEVVAKDSPAHNFLVTTATLTSGLTALAGSNTNHCDALAEGILELENLSTALYGRPSDGASADRRQLQPFVVLFTDGAPNAMRGIFDPVEMPATRCSTYTTGGGRTQANCAAPRDFYHYALEWVVGQPDPQPPLMYRGPGPFVQRAISNATQSQPTLFQFPIAAGSVAPNNSITCGVEQSDPTLFEQTITTNTGGTGAARERGGNTGCLTPLNPTNTFKFSIPNTNPDDAGIVGANSTNRDYLAGVSNVTISSDNWPIPDQNWPPAFFTPPVRAWGYQRYDQLPYYCAIEAADYIRTRFAGTFYVIGLGPTASMLRATPGRTGCNDPLQDADDHVGRKDWFLSRLAFSRNIASNPTTPTDVEARYQFSLLNPTQYADNRSVFGCDRHRFSDKILFPPPATLPRFPLTSGYTSTSPSQRVDGPTTYQDLRPFRPKVMDGLHENELGPQYRRLDTQGEYFPTSNANEVPNIFGIIAKAILLRATS